MLSRRQLFAVAPVILMGTAAHAAAAGPAMTVYKSASCGCCGGWIKAMTAAGYSSKVVLDEDLAGLMQRHRVPLEVASCHLATVGGYVVVGHVPPADVARLLKEKPKALGITVPGMPLGSPGMETPDGRREPFQTLLLLPGGATRVFARHG